MKTRLLAGLALACLAVALAATGPASAADHAWLGETSAGRAYGYTLEAEALGRVGATDLTLRIQPNGVRADVTQLEAVMILTRSPRPPRLGLKILHNVPVGDGVAEIVLQPLPSGTSVAIDVLFYAGTPRLPYALHDNTVVRLRPDLVVASLVAPAQTLTSRAFDVIAVIEEVNGDLGARDASVSLRWGPVPARHAADLRSRGPEHHGDVLGGHASRSRLRRADGRHRRRRLRPSTTRPTTPGRRRST